MNSVLENVMKVKEIIYENVPNQPATITKVSDNQVTYKTTGGQEQTANVTDIQMGPDGKPVLQVPQIQPGAAINVVQVPPNSQQTTNQPMSNTTDQEIKISEINDESDDLSSMTDNELIDLARHEGIEDSVKIDDNGSLVNRDEIIKLLTTGADIGGDQTDDFIQDVEDPEFGQMMERIRQLSGL